MSFTPPRVSRYTRPSLLRHLAAIAYDLCLLLAVLFFAAALAVAINHGEAITAENPFFLLYLLGVSMLFYGGFWTHGGQTLGMRSWKLILISEHGPHVTWRQAMIRFFVALCCNLLAGWGLWWPRLTRRPALADRLSQTRLLEFPLKERLESR